MCVCCSLWLVWRLAFFSVAGWRPFINITQRRGGKRKEGKIESPALAAGLMLAEAFGHSWAHRSILDQWLTSAESADHRGCLSLKCLSFFPLSPVSQSVFCQCFFSFFTMPLSLSFAFFFLMHYCITPSLFLYYDRLLHFSRFYHRLFCLAAAAAAAVSSSSSFRLCIALCVVLQKHKRFTEQPRSAK